MFHIYEGFHLVDAYHKMRHQRKYNPDTKRAVKIALVAIVTLLLSSSVLSPSSHLLR